MGLAFDTAVKVLHDAAHIIDVPVGTRRTGRALHLLHQVDSWVQLRGGHRQWNGVPLGQEGRVLMVYRRVYTIHQSVKCSNTKALLDLSI